MFCGTGAGRDRPLGKPRRPQWSSVRDAQRPEGLCSKWEALGSYRAAAFTRPFLTPAWQPKPANCRGRSPRKFQSIEEMLVSHLFNNLFNILKTLRGFHPGVAAASKTCQLFTQNSWGALGAKVFLVLGTW